MGTERIRENVGIAQNRAEFRAWLEANAATERECWVHVKRGRPTDAGTFYYLDAVEEALCFGWIDSTANSGEGGMRLQRFGPRKPGGNWTELNKERVRRLERLGLMTSAGRAVLPPMGPRSFRFDPQVVADLKAARAWTAFRRLPALYQRVRANNLAFYRTRHPEPYLRMLAHTVETAKQGKTFGEWNDYGRLG